MRFVNKTVYCDNELIFSKFYKQLLTILITFRLVCFLFNMLFASPSKRLLNVLCYNCRLASMSKCHFSDSLDSKYTNAEKDKIMQVINNSDIDTLSSYDISKVKLKKITEYKRNNGQIKTLADIEYIEGFTEKSAKKLISSILNNKLKENNVTAKIKGQILYPHLSAAVIKASNSILSIYVTVNSVCWTLINKDNYEVQEWKYYNIDYPDGKRLQITDILNIAWRIVNHLPTADIYVMKAEATTLRAAGSDPNNPKVLAVNLQKSQMISMIIALVNARNHQKSSENESEEDQFNQRVYFLRPTLPYRLYGTLVGTERVSTEQTVEMLLQEFSEPSPNNSHAYVPTSLQEMFRSMKDLQKDMLGHCLLLSLTFMDLCIYKNQERIDKLIKRGGK